MEPVAINQIEITKDLFSESHAAVFSIRRQQTLLSCGIVFLLFGLVLFFFRTRLPGIVGLYTMLLLTGAIVVLFALTLKKTDFQKKYRAFRQKNGDVSTRTVTCDRTGIIIDTGKGEPVRIDYTEVRDFRETPHLYLLLCSDHQGVQLSRNGFILGNWDLLWKTIAQAKEQAEAMRELI